ncbi:MAG: tetratricopeptide repeat-containing sulfotransferase family protein [Steroidobacteraceae bacterium]
MSQLPIAAFEQEIGAHLGSGDLDAAAAAAQACRDSWPGAPTGWLMGSIIALLAGDPRAGLRLIEEPLRTWPTNAQCLLQKAECLLALGERSLALAAAEAAAAHSGDIADSLEAIGEFMLQAGEQRRALPLYDRAMTVMPRDPAQRARLLHNRAVTHRYVGDLERAQRDYEAILAIDPVAPKAYKGLVELRRQTPERNRITQMKQALERLPAQSDDAAVLHFALAKSYQDLGDYRSSWEHLSEANRIERTAINYDPAADRELMQALEEVFTATEAKAGHAATESPIFIVGLPRSGSTLIERILSNHPQVHQCGELTAVTDSILALTNPTAGAAPPSARDFAARLAGLDGGSLAAEYRARTRAFRPEGRRWTDKQLSNFVYCPLLLRAFPRARIVHVTRHPLAACYAIYRTRFNGSYPFAYDLDEIAEFYVSYRRLMQHWQRILPDRTLELPYEQVVRSFEPSVRSLLEYVGLPFDAACLEFHRNPAPVITTSSVQVRQPLYDSSLEQWRQYAAWLAPARARLEAAGITLE